tara:strand:+ start:28 stop:138 length:111 start_codon:yes stop_codon:yes gene_type:complete
MADDKKKTAKKTVKKAVKKAPVVTRGEYTHRGKGKP